jgi:nitrogen fixation protein NifU and related proteins
MTIYNDILMDHYHFPRNRGCAQCEETGSSRALNPSCGDKIEVKLRVESGVITDICFEATGCAISIASSSMLTEYCKGKEVVSVLALTFEDLARIMGITITPGRSKCALLPLQAIHEALASE